LYVKEHREAAPFPPPTPAEAPFLRGMRAFWTGGWRDPDSTSEGIDFLSSFRQASETVSLASGHFVQRDNPKVVTDVIRTLVAQARHEAGAKTAARLDESAHVAMATATSR
jgi:hypothetical protein